MTTRLHLELEEKCEDAIADHRHAVGIIRLRDKQITYLNDKNVAAMRQNRRLSAECRRLTEELSARNKECQTQK